MTAAAGRAATGAGREAAGNWRVLPAAEAGADAVAAVFGARGPAATCHCQRYKLAPRESFAALGREELTFRLQLQAADPPGPGLVGFEDDQPVAWCAVESRADYAGLLRAVKVPWEGRDENRADRGVWAVTCFTTRSGHRRRGYGSRLAVAAVEHARLHGARAIEGYPILTTAVITEELHVGTLGMFTRAGFTEVHRPTPRRAVVRLEL